jgi:predicted nucleotidyltransferase
MSEQRGKTAVLARNQARGDISRIAAEHRAHNVRVFGSAGRGEPSAHDLDLLVEMEGDRNLLDLIALSQALEDAYLGIAPAPQTAHCRRYGRHEPDQGATQ